MYRSCTSVDQGGAAAGHDALLEGRAGRGHGVLDAVLALLGLDLGRGAHLDDRDAAGELGQALLELLAVPVRVHALDLGAQLGHALLESLLRAAAVDDRGVVLGDRDPPGGAQLVQADRVQADAQLAGDQLAAGQHGQVLHDGLAAVAEPGGLEGHHVQVPAHLVDHQGGQRLALDVLGDDRERLLGLHDLLQDGHEVRDRGDLALVEQDRRVLEHRFLALGVGDEGRGEVPLVELHALGDGELDLGRGAVLDRDDAVLADLLEGLGEQLADLLGLGRDGRHVGDVLALDLAGVLQQAGGDGLHGGLDARADLARGGAGGHVAQALGDQRLGEHGRGGGAVAGDVVGLGGDFLGQLRAEVLVRVVELHLAGDGHAVVGDQRGSPLLVEDDVAAARAESHLDGVGELVHTGLEGLAGSVVEFQLLCHRFQ
jgi:hypothetical protein